ncbi:MAG TPA: ATP-binding protein [Casimicrobiaceae bacterium]|nr:ATP-binding protein [Casimicrobiaceae bacterium]
MNIRSLIDGLSPASWKARLKRVERGECEQAVLRVTVVGLIVLYLLYASNRDGIVDATESYALWWSEAALAFGIVLLGWIVLAGNKSVVRRVLGMIVDNACTTYFLILTGEAGAVIFGVYLFVTFGNGFRYGRAYLHASQALSLIGFGLVVVFSEYWRTHTSLSIGVALASLTLPFYVGILAQRIEEARRRADEANQAKGRFVANMSHEMRTPLNGVIAMADVLRETALSEAQREIVETMTTSANLLLVQIEDVLDMAKIEAGRVTVEKRPFEPARLLPATVKVILPQARYKGLAVNVDIDPGVAGWYLGDAHHLRQVILNLLANAVKFTEKGEITLRARMLVGEANALTLRIEVQDTGVGIAEDKQAAIFEPFTQADDSITRVYGGTGLGTTIARHLMSHMDGRIGLKSRVGIGSTFWIELPLEVSEAQGVDLTEELASAPRSALASYALAAAQPATIHRLRGARILVAEDNPTNQRVAQLILESGGHHVTIVENGEKALDALERGGFDVALFDLSMPLVSGIEALKLYRFTTSTPIPVLILSANVTTEAIDECHRAGAAEFMPKPLRASLLLDAIERHISSSEQKAVHRPQLIAEERPVLSVVDVPPLDPAVLADLAKLSRDETFLDRLLRGFRRDTERLAHEITNSLVQRRYEGVKDAAHALKGGAASVGATKLYQLATRLDKASPEMLRLKAAQFTEELDATVGQAIEALDRFLESRQADQNARPKR